MAVRQAINLLRGSVSLEVTGAFPERFLNLCAQRRIAFWGVERPEEHILRLTVAWKDRKELCELGKRAGCTVRELHVRGAPAFLLRFRRRYALLVGLAFTVLAVSVLSRFILLVDVEGNQRVPTAVILTELARQGLKPGVYGPGLATREISSAALLKLDGLAWMTVNVHGIRAQVMVRERVKEMEPVDRSILGDIVAEAPGIVTHIEAWAGDPAVEEGATVVPGDVLIRGSMRLDPPQYSEEAPIYVPVRAMGKVEGRTWRRLQASIPLTAQVKTATDDEKSFWSLTFLSQRVNFYQNSGIPFERYDKITKTWNLTLPGGQTLPLALRRETCRAYTLTQAQVDPGAAQAMLEEQLERRLEELLGESGEVTRQDFSAVQRDGMLIVTLRAECSEELGRFQSAS